jgi:hypothetical protein
MKKENPIIPLDSIFGWPLKEPEMTKYFYVCKCEVCNKIISKEKMTEDHPLFYSQPQYVRNAEGKEEEWWVNEYTCDECEDNEWLSITTLGLST